jgi:hypothetical protein
MPPIRLGSAAAAPRASCAGGGRTGRRFPGDPPTGPSGRRAHAPALPRLPAARPAAVYAVPGTAHPALPGSAAAAPRGRRPARRRATPPADAVTPTLPAGPAAATRAAPPAARADTQPLRPVPDPARRRPAAPRPPDRRPQTGPRSARGRARSRRRRLAAGTAHPARSAPSIPVPSGSAGLRPHLPHRQRRPHLPGPGEWPRAIRPSAAATPARAPAEDRAGSRRR